MKAFKLENSLQCIINICNWCSFPGFIGMMWKSIGSRFRFFLFSLFNSCHLVLVDNDISLPDICIPIGLINWLISIICSFTILHFSLKGVTFLLAKKFTIYLLFCFCWFFCGNLYIYCFSHIRIIHFFLQDSFWLYIHCVCVCLVERRSESLKGI